MKTTAAYCLCILFSVVFQKKSLAQARVESPRDSIIRIKARVLSVSGGCCCYVTTPSTASFYVLQVFDGNYKSKTITIDYSCRPPSLKRNDIVYIRASKYPGQQFYREVYTINYSRDSLQFSPNFKPVFGIRRS